MISLLEKIKSNKAQFERWMKRNRIFSLWLRVSAGFFGAASTFCIALGQIEGFNKGESSTNLTISALAFSGFVTVIVTWEGVFNYREDFARFKRAFGRISALEIVLEYEMQKDPVDEEEMKKILGDLKKIIIDAHTPEEQPPNGVSPV